MYVCMYVCMYINIFTYICINVLIYVSRRILSLNLNGLSIQFRNICLTINLISQIQCNRLNNEPPT